MCGIAGIVVPDGEEVCRDTLAAMTATLRHRGPDADGLWLEANVGLGHRRLAVIDLSQAADQPLGNEDGSVQVILNGEIYNFQALRRELAAKGHVFRTQSDTEALAHGWEEWGSELPRRLRGMFAFVLYDRRQRLVFLARDRVGKKPFFYHLGGDSFLFGSEIKALLAHPAVSRELDPAAFGEHMVYGNVVGERTAFRAIRRLAPGTSLLLATGTRQLVPRLERYWRFTPQPDSKLDRAALLDELDATISEAVRLRLISDVPLGAFLSGGIDSSLIVAHMVRHSSAPVETFCVGFHEAGWDESAAAQAVADHLGTRHHLEWVTPDAVAVLPQLVRAFDEPFADPSAIPTWYVSQMTRRRVTVALSGDGGDELFYGYRRYWETETLRRWGTVLTPPGRWLARGAAQLLPVGSFPRRALDRMSYRGFDLYHHAVGFAPEYLSLLTPETRAALGPAAAQPAKADFERHPGLSFLERCRAMDIERYLPDQILVKADRASMQHSLEVRSPLLDQEVIELAGRVPVGWQLAGRRQKLLLRELAYRHVPKALLDRPKQGFAVPLRRWFRGELRPWMERALADTTSLTWTYFRRDVAGRRFASHLAGRANAETALWRLLFFYAWAEEGAWRA